MNARAKRVFEEALEERGELARKLLESLEGDASSIDDDVEYDRAHEAVMLLCHRMNRDEHAPSDGQKLAVPVGLDVGSATLDEDNPEMERGPAMTWIVRVRPKGAVRTREGNPIDPDAMWETAANMAKRSAMPPIATCCCGAL